MDLNPHCIFDLDKYLSLSTGWNRTHCKVIEFIPICPKKSLNCPYI